MGRKVKTTEEQYEEFKKAFTDWQDRLNLNDYRVFFELGLREYSEDTCFAEIDIAHDGKAATVRLSKTMDPENAEDFKPELSAKHEAAHLFLNKLEHVARCRYIRPDDISDTVEGMVRVLEKVL